MKCLWLFLPFALCAWSAGAAEVVLANPSFETIDPVDPAKATGWYFFSETGEPPAIAVTNEASRDGATSMKIGFTSKKDGFVGLIQEVAVEPGQKLKFAGFFKKIEIKEGTYLKLGIEWKRADGSEVSRIQDGDINAKTLASGDWCRFEVSGAAPAGAAKAVLTVTCYAGNQTTGSILADAMSLETLNK